ncbi:MAG: MGMT family protein, partial [Bdellovibrionales bacterium]|nr:MGMT family protein [Bdellovibrionales bacterium]NQZ19819.1 MGMT family protein [Bdellovibrionales bacterium]
MNNIEIPFYSNSLKVSYTSQGLTDVSFQKKKVSSFSEKDPMAKKINKSISTYLDGQSDQFDLPVDWNNLKGTDFQKKVWKTMFKIPYGKVKTYGQIAKTVG